jgi:hypothetical protein
MQFGPENTRSPKRGPLLRKTIRHVGPFLGQETQRPSSLVLRAAISRSLLSCWDFWNNLDIEEMHGFFINDIENYTRRT